MSKKFAVPALVTLAFAGALGAYAQAAETMDEEARKLGTVTVTAQRREQAIEDVTATLAVIDGDDLSDRGVRDFNNLGKLTPNVQIEGGYGNASNPVITIRGVGISDFNDNNSSPAGVYVDEVYFVSPPMLAFGLFDVERVEVVKGPQGTLYGRNTTAGAINFVSRKPTREFEGFGRLSYEEFDRLTLEGAVGGPVSDTLAFRLSALSDKGGDYIENRFTGGDEGGRDLTALRFQTLWEPSDRFDVLLNIHGAQEKSDIGQYQHVGLLANPETFEPCAPAVAGGIDPTSCFDPFGYSDTDGDVNAGDYNFRGALDYESFGGALRMNWQLSDRLTLTSVTGYEEFSGPRTEDADGSPNQLLEIVFDVDVEQFSQELRLAGEAGRLDFILGAYYGTDEIRNVNDFDVFRDFRPFTGFDPTSVFLARNAYIQETDVIALFGHGFWSLTDAWTLETGLRYSEETRDFNTVSSFIEDPADLAAIGLGPDGVFLDETRDFDSDNILWTMGLSREFDNGLLLFGKASNGFKSGGFNGGIPFTPEEVVPYDDETLLAYEIGLKGPLFDGRARFDIAAFLYDYQDLQIFDVVDTESGVPIQILTNAADSEIYGIDASLSANLADGLNGYLGLGLLSAEYIDAEIGTIDLSGRTLPNSPGVSLTGGLDYERPIGPFTGRFSINGAYSGEEDLEIIEIVPGEIATISEDGYWLVDLRAALAGQDDRWELALFAKNVFDEQPLNGTLTLNDFGFAEYVYGLPRRLGVSLELSF